LRYPVFIKIANAMNNYSEDALVEQPALALLSQLGWDTANCFNETIGAESMLRRETFSEVVLFSLLRLSWWLK
jgi:type I restriction enzyme R subunit